MDPKELAKQLKDERTRVSGVIKILDSLAKAEPEDDLSALFQRSREVAKAEKLVGELKAWQELFRALEAFLQQRKVGINSAAEQGRRRFGTKLESALKPLGLSLSGQAPELRAGLFTIELEFDRGRARIWYGPKQEQLGDCRLKPAEIVGSIKKTRESLGSDLEPSAFLDRLYRAYCRVGGGNERRGKPVIEVLGELAPLLQSPRFRGDPRAEHYKTYGRADFSFDLFRMSEAEQQTLFPQNYRLLVATRAHTRRRQGFLWVPRNERYDKGATYSHIQFDEKTK